MQHDACWRIVWQRCRSWGGHALPPVSHVAPKGVAVPKQPLHLTLTTHSTGSGAVRLQTEPLFRRGCQRHWGSWQLFWCEGRIHMFVSYDGVCARVDSLSPLTVGLQHSLRWAQLTALGSWLVRIASGSHGGSSSGRGAFARRLTALAITIVGKACTPVARGVPKKRKRVRRWSKTGSLQCAFARCSRAVKQGTWGCHV